jgi:TRAP-type mannitol/chloroaromatic compound transport system permease small subunit
LLISALARTDDAAALVPVAVMPRIILAGVIVPLSGLGELLAKVAISVYWTRQSLESLLPDLPSNGYWGPLSVVSVHAAAFVLLALGGLGPILARIGWVLLTAGIAPFFGFIYWLIFSP